MHAANLQAVGQQSKVIVVVVVVVPPFIKRFQGGCNPNPIYQGVGPTEFALAGRFRADTCRKNLEFRKEIKRFNPEPDWV